MCPGPAQIACPFLSKSDGASQEYCAGRTPSSLWDADFRDCADTETEPTLYFLYKDNCRILRDLERGVAKLLLGAPQAAESQWSSPMAFLQQVFTEKIHWAIHIPAKEMDTSNCSPKMNEATKTTSSKLV